MTTERLSDGRRIAQLLSSELTARTDGPLSTLSVVDTDPDAEASESGTFAYAIEQAGIRLAAAFLHPDRLRLEFQTGDDAVRSAAEAADLRVDDESVVYLADGGAVKRVLDVLAAAEQGDRKTE